MAKPYLRIINNNLEFDRQTVARVFDVEPTLMHRFEQHIQKVNDVMQQVEDLKEKVIELKREIDTRYA
tara:strand:+ start:3510 stop:3713 length:204 start_codon:yes stop_codon:yes gene_type:complete